MSCSWCQQSYCGAVAVFPFLVDKYLREGTVKLLRPIILELVPILVSLMNLICSSQSCGVGLMIIVYFPLSMFIDWNAPVIQHESPLLILCANCFSLSH